MGNTIDDHAVVLRGSVAGMLAARMLSDSYRQVTVVDRDDMAATGGPRAAVPQGHHIHALLGRGQQILDELCGGLTAELEAAGVPTDPPQALMRPSVIGRVLRGTRNARPAVAAAPAAVPVRESLS
jgi:2-polyprenyl-6-methoxyphenol hydroxylase-like FAD-dependent oxidoreductase